MLELILLASYAHPVDISLRGGSSAVGAQSTSVFWSSEHPESAAVASRPRNASASRSNHWCKVDCQWILECKIESSNKGKNAALVHYYHRRHRCHHLSLSLTRHSILHPEPSLHPDARFSVFEFDCWMVVRETHIRRGSCYNKINIAQLGACPTEWRANEEVNWTNVRVEFVLSSAIELTAMEMRQ